MDKIPEDIRAAAGALADEAPDYFYFDERTQSVECEWGKLRDSIARALLAQDRAATERAAKIAIERAEHHREYCEPECKCANGWHIAIAIRQP